MGKRFASTVAFAAVLAIGSSSAHAQPACSTVTNPLYVAGGSGSQPLIRRVGQRLAALGAGAPFNIVFHSTTTCVALDMLLNATALPSGNTGQYYDGTGTVATCSFPIGNTIVPDAVVMGNGAPLCPLAPSPLPAALADYLGPVSSVSMIVHKMSTEQSISAEAIARMYTMGAAANIAPWNNESFIYHRNDTAFTQLYVAMAAGISPTGWVGTDASTSTNTITLVGGTGNEQNRIGFVTSEIADGNSGAVHALAYQHTGQSCGYWPDSTSGALDKANVRNGQYYLWGPTHFYAWLDAPGGNFVSARAGQFLELLSEITPIANVSVVDASIQAGNIPACAMHVTRTTDLGPIMSYAPPEPCGCYYEQHAAGSTACAACVMSTDCPNATDVCRLGYCEAY